MGRLPTWRMSATGFSPPSSTSAAADPGPASSSRSTGRAAVCLHGDSFRRWWDRSQTTGRICGCCRSRPPRSSALIHSRCAEGTSASAIAGTSARACSRRRIRVGNGVRCGRGSSHRSSDPQDHARAGWRLPGWDHGRSGERLVRRPRPSRARPSRPANASAGRETDSSRRCTGMAGAGHATTCSSVIQFAGPLAGSMCARGRRPAGRSASPHPPRLRLVSQSRPQEVPFG